MRQVLACPPIDWDRSLASWLPTTLTHNLPKPFLSTWLDILINLRLKVSLLVDRALSLLTQLPSSPAITLDACS